MKIPRPLVENGLWRMIIHPIVLAWLISLFLVVPLFEWCDFLVLMLAFMIVPIVALGAWLVGVPIWLICATFARLYRRRWLVALRYFTVLPIGIAIGLVGLKCGDLIAVVTYGSLLKNEVETVRTGAAPKRSNGLFSSSLMAFKLTGGFLDISTGIVYDSSGQAGKMLTVSPSLRPHDWQENAVDVLTCQGSARHLFGNFYLITVSLYSC